MMNSGGGVTFSGGEPLQQAPFLAALLRACRAEDLHTALDTCGYAPWETLDRLRADVNLFLYDIKPLDETLHQRCTGVSNQVILSNLRQLAEGGAYIILRVPLIPGITDQDEHIHAVAKLAKELPNIQRVDLLPYHDAARLKYQRLNMPYPLAFSAALSPERITALAEILAEYHLQTKIGG